MISSATRSSSAVTTPGRMRRATSVSARPTRSALRRSPSMSRGDLRWIIGKILAATADATALHEAVVVAHEEVRLDLLERVERDADEDEQARPAVEAGEARRDPGLRGERREDRDEAEEDRARQRDPRQDVVDELARLLARPDARDEAALPLHRVGHLLRI